jgi:chorismate mutase
VATKTEVEARDEARERIQQASERAGEGNGQRSDATREQIRGDQDRFAQLQERYQQQAREQADEAKQQLQQANETGREAVAQYVRALTRSYQAFLPQAAIRPHQAIDFAADVLVQGFELQRSVLHELVGAGQVNARAASRAAGDLSEHR